jgi:hypothetical protein
MPGMVSTFRSYSPQAVMWSSHTMAVFVWTCVFHLLLRSLLLDSSAARKEHQMMCIKLGTNPSSGN